MAECHSGPWSQLDSGSWVRDRSGLPAHTASGIPLRAQGAPVPSSPGAAWRGRATEWAPATRARLPRGHGLEGGGGASASRTAAPFPPQPPLPRRPLPSPQRAGRWPQPPDSESSPGALANPKRMVPPDPPRPDPNTHSRAHTHTHTCTRQHTRNIPAVCTRGIPCLSVFFLLLVGKGPRARPALCAALALRLGPAGGVRSWAAQARGLQGAWCRRGCRLTRALLCSQG